ncbi:hypothetical protein [Dactylosporangium salmoneum]|uniref:GIY-YIG nuclease family protein n=1 Tax=Dactylosporangium salmoneum TaxID=53361 RepID=A0ABN3FCP1_9ACTN
MSAGTIYLLHFERPFSHARHYLGWTGGPLPVRLQAHLAGQGARLLAAVHSAGITWFLARTWEGTRARERQIKRQGGLSRSCPMCGVRPASSADRTALRGLARRYPAYMPPSIRRRALPIVTVSTGGLL